MLLRTRYKNKFFYSCGFDIEKLKSFYQKYISNMEPSFIDDVKKEVILDTILVVVVLAL